MVDQKIALDAVHAGERVDQLVARVLDTGAQARVQLDPVARLEPCVLDDSRAMLRAHAESADSLAELDGSGAMAEPETDEAVHVVTTLLSYAQDQNPLARTLVAG
jgi:hypothetical protein